VKKHNKDPYARCGVYRLVCQDCRGSYVGQTGCTFTNRYNEHVKYIRSNNDITDYSPHILNTGHAFGKLQDTLKNNLKLQRKDPHLKTLEKFHIYKENKTGQLLNEVDTD
jgi:hypothetical protein